jgi:carbon monoxide dehydrogenase subunit G
MRITGSNVVEAPLDRVWEALLDPAVLVATIPGCERLVATGDHAYDMTVTAGVAAIKGTYTGTCSLSDLHERQSLTMRLSGAGAPGTVDATVAVSFAEAEPGSTAISYDADATVGGMVGGVGQRMLTSVSRRMAGEFFANVGRAITAPAAVPPAEPAASAPAPGPAGAPGVVFERPSTAGASAAPGGDFAKGIAVGAGLVALGVVLGRLLGRRP